MAADSTQRYKNKDTLSPIDGVLVVIKDEYHVVSGQLESRDKSCNCLGPVVFANRVSVFRGTRSDI